MRVKQIVSAAIVVAALAGVFIAAAQGLSTLYVIAGIVLVIATLVLVTSFGRTRGRRWALSSVALLVIAALIPVPILLNASRNPVLDFAPDSDARWMPDGDGGGYIVTTQSIQHLAASGDLGWERNASLATWSTTDGVITAEDDRVRYITASGDVAWEHTASSLDGSDDITPVAWSDGVTTVSVCDSPFDTPDWPLCRFVGIDAQGSEVYSLDGSHRNSLYPGGSFYFNNMSGLGANGSLPTHFALGSVEAASAEETDIDVADASTGRSVGTVPGAGDGSTLPTFVGDRVFTGTIADDTCTISAVPIEDDPGWSTEVPCLRYSDDTGTDVSLSDPSMDTGILDGEVLWWRSDGDWRLVGAGDLNAIGIDLETGNTVSVGKVLWSSLNKSEASDSALGAGGMLIEARDSELTVRDPFTDTTSWTASLHGEFRLADASSTTVSVVTKPDRPRLFASGDELELIVYSLDDGRVLGTERFDGEHARDVLALDGSALLVLDDGTSIRVGG